MGRLAFTKLKWRLSFIFFAILLAASLSIGYYGYSKAYSASIDNALQTGYVEAVDDAMMISAFLRSFPSDLDFIAKFYSMNNFIHWDSIGDEDEKRRWEKALSFTMRALLEAKGHYYSLRYIDRHGNERVNVGHYHEHAGPDHDKNDESLNIVPHDRLQNKKSSEYFIEGMKLEAGETYVSKLNLNREYGEIVRPFLPVVRICIPVIDKNGFRHGILVANVYAKNILDLMESKLNMDAGPVKHESVIISNTGAYLHHKDKGMLWADDLKHEKRFSAEYPDIFKELMSKEAGNIITQDNIVSFSRVYPSPISKEEFWVIVNYSDKKEMLADVEMFKYVFFMLLAAILLASFVVISRFSRLLTSPLEGVNRQLARMAKGDVPDETLRYAWKDEIGQILSSLHQLSVNMRKTIAQANIIAMGDYTKRVELLSDDDRLGQALNEMSATLEKNQLFSREENWVKDGLNELSKTLSGEEDLAQLCSVAVGFIASYSNVSKGAFYRYDSRSQNLSFYAGYAMGGYDETAAMFPLGMGTVGQVAQDKKPIMLYGIPDAGQVLTGTTEASVLATYTLPLLQDDVLVGVVEFASHKPLDDLQLRFIREASVYMATSVNAGIKNNEVKSLLEITEEAQLELEQRSVELEEANRHMQNQQVQLEEANAQLEEQQQQLKLSELELREKNTTLEESQKELDIKAKELELSSQYKSEFLANMSHELRTPLNSIMLLSSLLSKNKKRNLDADDIKKAATINRSGNDLLRLINDILDLSKVESGQMEIVIDHFRSEDFLEETKDLFEHLAEEKSLYFHIEDEYKGAMTTDRNRLSQIIRNLLSNAFKFTKEGGITVKLARSTEPGFDFEASVTDTGLGIPQEKQQQIFEAFKQVDGSTSREYGGTGLGLSISKELSHLLGGEIRLYSQAGEGSTFSIHLPNLQGETAVNEMQTSRQTARSVVQNNEATLLIIEDDEEFSRLLQENIKELGVDTLAAYCAKDGLALARTHKPGGIVLDLGLPDMDGMDLLREIKSDVSLREIPVYILSARDKESAVMHSGIIGYSKKPVDEEGIAELVGKISGFRQKRVKELLIVEDDEIQREAMMEWIGSDGIRHHGASSASEAADELKKGIYDAVIVDLGLKDSSGYEVCDFVASHCPETPIIIYTGRDITKKEHEELRKYTDSIIIKTVNSQERLLDEIDIFLHKSRAVKPAVQTVTESDISLEGVNILVVDDDIKNIFVLDAALDEYDARTMHASNGAEALEVLRKSDGIDIVLMDIMMPVMNGYDAIKAMREDERLKGVPVIAITAKAMADDRQKCIDAGADDYLTKPIDISALTVMIRTLVDKKRPWRS